MSFRNDRFNHALLSTDFKSLHGKAISVSDHHQSLKRMLDQIDWSTADESPEESRMLDMAMTVMWGCLLNTIKRGHLTTTMVLIARNGCDRRKSIRTICRALHIPKHVAKRLYFRHRTELIGLLVSPNENRGEIDLERFSCHSGALDNIEGCDVREVRMRQPITSTKRKENEQ